MSAQEARVRPATGARGSAVGYACAVGHEHGRWIDTLLMQRGLAGGGG